MSHPSQTDHRKFQVFPKGGQASTSKCLDPGTAFSYAMGHSIVHDRLSPSMTAPVGMRPKVKENSLFRRRKASVPELGPMTTVHEVPMDSPTIPGRPPVHERSISAPDPSCREFRHFDKACAQDRHPPDRKPPPSLTLVARSASHVARHLPHLEIPKISLMTTLTSPFTTPRLRSFSVPVSPAQTSVAKDDSPKITAFYTPPSASPDGQSLTTPRSAVVTGSVSLMPTLPSRPTSLVADARLPLSHWDSPSCSNQQSQQTSESPSSISSTPVSRAFPPVLRRALADRGHHRSPSESSGSVMERGRPRKRRARGEDIDTKKARSAERRAFEELPHGWLVTDAMSKLDKTEVKALQQQAIGQTAQFEVLRAGDVQSLSNELRQLDERTEYLRRTYSSLRAGRRNLHSRICDYLRFPRAALFNIETMLRQEEALAELDASIDDWMLKLEYAENRRLRVRQKLLEHLAAAATLPTSSEYITASPEIITANPAAAAAASKTLQIAMGIRTAHVPIMSNATNGITYPSTPPRSPPKGAMTPLCPSCGTSSIPSTILEHPVFEEAAGSLDFDGQPEIDTLAASRVGFESIRVYADSDVSALLADVETKISQMGCNPSLATYSAKKSPKVAAHEPSASGSPELARIRQFHRDNSRNLLVGQAPVSYPATVLPIRPLPPAPPRKNSPPKRDFEPASFPYAMFRPEQAAV